MVLGLALWFPLFIFRQVPVKLWVILVPLLKSIEMALLTLSLSVDPIGFSILFV